ncbi:hypothetical protein NSA56_18370 [Oceanobacillus caeni]|uniref:Group-specific protein n=1 Tax=Oceanobacillus caeni TaxID=405946 RepID=A0ABR5MK39_9BACI|nr:MULTISPECIES: hypothetical protein [Bacillaceae]KKE77828.1 hypothetical protein WH51_15815 [Bacilli bacterium VT-13-104]PZD81372.1 hypothetical protein DEJ64_17605 [Bacilli bacterium]KPH76052.1 hypothetical protein AFL42_07015 [Oceanobacillus caeni]MCR1836278.1 hypothetical protein [Oceanobacillus caeni]MED4473586.1 hypothetical protein [Oceanobacillus caeni]
MIEAPFIEVKIDDEVLEQQIFKHIEEKMIDIGHDKIFYSLDDLTHITSFSKGHIMNTFFDDSRFKHIRRRVGRKWVFPVEETNEFLKEWIKEQPNE